MTLNSLLTILLQVISPVVLIAGIGYLFGWRTRVDVQPISRLVFYVLAPALVFDSLSRLDWEGSGAQKMVVFALLSVLGQGVLAWLVARLLRLRPPLSNSFLLVSMLSNCGNFGLPLTLFAWGQEGMDTALVFFVVIAVLGYSVGLYIASRGQAGARKALRNVAQAPLLWAGLAGFLVSLCGLRLPGTLERAVQLVGQGATPVMLLVLGMQLAHVSLSESKTAIAAATVMRLAVAPVLAIGLTALLGMQGLARQVGILEASMPAAVTTTILTTEYDAAPRFAASVVFISTLLSLVSLTLLLGWLAPLG